MRQGFEYAIHQFKECLFTDAPVVVKPSMQWSDDAWIKDQGNRNFIIHEGYWPLRQGRSEGTIVGGSYHSFILLQGSDYFPPLADSMLFMESPSDGKVSLMSLDSALRSLSFQKGFERVRGIVIGRYSRDARISPNNLQEIIDSNPAVPDIPIIANVDFGHTTPMMTFPIGGICKLDVSENQVYMEFPVH